MIGGKRFRPNNEVIIETNTYFENHSKIILYSFKKLETRWTNCVELLYVVLKTYLFTVT